MDEIVVIDGEISLENTLDGEVELEAITDLDPEVVLSAGGGITPSGTINITSNGVYDVTEYASADVDVQGGITPTGTKQITIASNGTVTEDVTSYASAEITTNVPASAVDTGTKSISTNGTHDVVGYASANVQVPNSYSVSDEGKVVSNGALVAQTSDTVTENDTYDTTLINSLTVNVSGSSGITVDEIAMESAPTGAVTLNSATEIKAYALYGKPITSISAPYVTKLDGNAFANTAIVNLDNPFPSMVPSTSTLGNTAGGYIFGNMTALKRVYLTQAGTWCARLDTFRGCSELVVLRLPNQTGNTEQRATTDCRKLKVIDWGKGRVHVNAFNGCYLFDTLILRDSSVQALSNVSAFTNTPFRGYNSLSGTIYVPSSLISSYQQASNWSSLYAEGHCTFSALENSTYKNTDWDDSALWQ